MAAIRETSGFVFVGSAAPRCRTRSRSTLNLGRRFLGGLRPPPSRGLAYERFAIAAMWSGVLPQHPPAILIPDRAKLPR